jgi:polar amino acid transport system substrate-binding protein
MNKIKLLTAALVLSWLGSGYVAPAVADQLELLVPGQLSAGTEGTYPPFSFQKADGQLDGIEIRLMREIARRLNLEYHPVVGKFETLLSGLKAGKYDMVSSPLDITEERRKQITYTDAWIESGAGLVVRKNSDIQTAANVAGKTIGVLKASTWADLAPKLNPADVKTYQSETDTLQDLVNGNIDAVLNDDISSSYDIEKSKLPLRIVDTPLTKLQKASVVEKGKPNLVKAIDKQIADIMADGTYAKIIADFLGVNPAPKDPIRSNL